MDYIFRFFKGVLIGAGAILPGVSGGVICVALGIYEQLINSILSFFSNINKNLKFLFPVVIGISIGIVCFSKILKFFYSNYNIQFSFCLTGFVLGSIPKLLKSANIKKIHLYHILVLLFTLSLSIYLVINQFYGNTFISFSNSKISYVFTGLAMSAGVVIPGISSTVILMILGKYSNYLSSISSLNFSILFPLGIGLLCGSIILLFLTKYMFIHFKSITYFSIIGFMLGSIPAFLPSIPNFKMFLFGFIFLVFGFLISIKLSALH